MGDQAVSLSSPALPQWLIMSTFYPSIEILIAHTIYYNSLTQIWPSQSTVVCIPFISRFLS